MLQWTWGYTYLFKLVFSFPLDKYPDVKLLNYRIVLGFPGSSSGKEPTCNAEDPDSIPGSGKSPGGGHGNPLLYSCLENPHGQRSLGGYSTWCHKESEMTTHSAEWFYFFFFKETSYSFIVGASIYISAESSLFPTSSPALVIFCLLIIAFLTNVFFIFISLNKWCWAPFHISHLYVFSEKKICSDSLPTF